MSDKGYAIRSTGSWDMRHEISFIYSFVESIGRIEFLLGNRYEPFMEGNSNHLDSFNGLSAVPVKNTHPELAPVRSANGNSEDGLTWSILGFHARLQYYEDF